MSDLEIRPASLEEFAIAVEWAASEGWNPGLDDLRVFHSVDPAGFLMAWKAGQPVASITVVNYSAEYGFLGFYIVHPDYRGTGVGMAIWNVGMRHLGDRTIGLDGVVDQQENYKKSGFVYAGRNIRFTGIPNIDKTNGVVGNIRDNRITDIAALLNYDRRHFPANRESFTRAWTCPEFGPGRRTKIAVLDNKIIGYGTLRACRSGYKIGPLFANEEQIACRLFEELCSDISDDSEISLDVPEANRAAFSMANAYGLEPVFETARMYRGTIAPLPLATTFGITTFELG